MATILIGSVTRILIIFKIGIIDICPQLNKINSFVCKMEKKNGKQPIKEISMHQEYTIVYCIEVILFKRFGINLVHIDASIVDKTTLSTHFIAPNYGIFPSFVTKKKYMSWKKSFAVSPSSF